MPAIDRDAFIDGLGDLPSHCVIRDAAELRPYECDGLSAYRVQPWLVLLPETIEQVQSILRYCHGCGVAVVARGAGTGLSGGALPLDNGVLLSLAKFNRILEIDAENRLAKVQPGVRNLAISQAVAELGLYYAPDPSSQIACSIGGNVLALMTGSEGLLGIIVEVTVRLLPVPERAQVILAAFDTIETAGEAVAAIISAGILPAGLEMMDTLAIQAAEDFVHAGYPVNAAAILLCELDGTHEDVSVKISEVRSLLKSMGASEVRTAQDEQERQRFWAGRKAAFPAVGRISPDYYCMDGTIPRKHLGKVLATISQWSDEYQLPVANVFHAGDGNLHPLILYDANKPGELERAEKFGSRILELSVSVGGTITGEHGVGMEKINEMCVQFNTAELTQFHAIKTAFDPQGLLNPGKAIPTLARCAEFGSMHVHNGELPFPELDRF
jgi:glycolate oxidase